MECIVEVGGGVWMQKDPDLVVPSVLQSLEKLKHLVFILNCSWLLVTPSLHVNSQHLEDTLPKVPFVCGEGNSKRTC